MIVRPFVVVNTSVHRVPARVAKAFPRQEFHVSCRSIADDAIARTNPRKLTTPDRPLCVSSPPPSLWITGTMEPRRRDDSRIPTSKKSPLWEPAE